MSFMKIYIGHSKDIDYLNDLYLPIRNDSFFNDYDVILPHEESEQSSNDRDFYKNIDLFIFECSIPATGLGIELGWAYDDNKKIYAIYRSDKKISGSVKCVTDNIYKYKDIDEMIDYIKKIIMDNN